MRETFHLIAIVLLAVPALAAEPGRWSSSLLDQARQADRPLVLLLNDASCAPCVAAESAGLADAGVADRLARDFVWARADRLERPDLADLFGLAVRELEGGEGYPLVAAVTPDGRPYLGRAGLDALRPATFERFATEAVSGFRVARSGLDPRAAAVSDALRAAQTPSPPLRPLGADVLESATRAVVGWSELGRADGPLPHGAVRFLLAEHARAGREELLKLALAALDLRLARGLAPSASTAEEAQRLETWTRAFAASGSAACQTEAARSADRLRAGQDGRGLWPESAGDPRAVAQTSGLAISALALSARTFGRVPDREAAEKAAAAVFTWLGAPAALARVEGGEAAFLDDHAALLAGLVELHETTGDPRRRGQAQAVAEATIGRFLDAAAGGFFVTGDAHEPLPVRVKHAFDGALPSGNGTLARVLPRLSRLTGEPRYAEMGRRTVEAFLGDLQRAPRGLLTLAEAAAEAVGPVRGTAAGEPDGSARGRETRGAVTVEARGPSAAVRAGQAFEVTLGLTIAPGWFVLARGVRAKDLAGLGVSVPVEGARPVAPRYPQGRPRRVAWNAAPIPVYESSASVPIRITLPPDAAAGERFLRLRVVFQACNESRCDKPESVTLEVPVRIDAARSEGGC